MRGRKAGSLCSKKMFSHVPEKVMMFPYSATKFYVLVQSQNNLHCVDYLQSQKDRFYLSGGNQVFIVLELVSQSTKMAKGRASRLGAFLLYVQLGCKWEAGPSTGLPSCSETEGRPVASGCSPAGSPMGTTCVMVHMLPPNHPTLNPSQRDTHHPNIFPTCFEKRSRKNVLRATAAQS